MKAIREVLEDKDFLKRTASIAIPIAAQGLLNNILNLVDVLMIAKLDEVTVASVGLANKVFFVLSLLLFGIASGSTILASQYWGKRELQNIKRVLVIVVTIGVLGSFLFLIPSVFAPEKVMRIFSMDEEKMRIGAIYLGVVALSYPLSAITSGYVAVLRSINSVKIPVIITMCSILVNIGLNYCLIFGHFGFPELGVLGAAIATLTARIVECGVLLLIAHSRKAGDDGIGDLLHTKMAGHGHILKQYFPKEFLSRYFATASMVMANEFLWGLGTTMYSLVYGRMADPATATMTITQTLEQLVFVLFLSIANAAAVILGNELGANELDKAKRHAKNYILLFGTLSIVGAIITYFIRWPLISIFSMSSSTNEYIAACLNVFILYMPFKMLNNLFIVAILRSGGDTKAALALDISGVWLIGVPMAVLGGLILKLPIYYVYAMILMEEIYKAVLGFFRYKKMKWLKNIIED